MFQIARKLVNWFTKNYKIVAVGIISILIATIFVQHDQLNKRNNEINRLTNNIRSYEQIVSNNVDNTRVLQLTVEELNNSKDSLLQELVSTKKQLNIKDKNLEYTQVINTEIRDSTKTVVQFKSEDFNKELQLNPLTTITVQKQDSILTAKLNISNQQTLFVEEKKEYKNYYKNGWSRFWHFDYKKIRIKKYQINNSNPIIKVTSTRVVEIPN